MTPRPSKQEIKQLRARYSAPKQPLTFTVIHCGKVVFEGPAGLCQWFINQNALQGAVKKPKP